MSGNTEFISIASEDADYVRGVAFNSPRELAGWVLSAIDQTLDEFEGPNSASFVDSWYRSAEIASYDSTARAAAYLGAYGPRSILKYQEAVFALITLKGRVRKQTRVVDYGAGPCVGFAALADLWTILAERLQQRLELEYVAVDRSDAMLEVGDALCRRLGAAASVTSSYELLRPADYVRSSADVLITANVMNDGEGNTDCRQFLSPILESTDTLDDIVAIEPATEGPSRQMCGLTALDRELVHIGPCPSAGSGCNEWSFREFTKRVYVCERRCLGSWAPAARICRYSLALLSSTCAPRLLPAGTQVVVGRSSSSGFAMTCRFGQKQRLRTGLQGSPWDIVQANGQVERWWP